jgi:acetyltransferase-like isoleucine patch superfamily enzyme
MIRLIFYFWTKLFAAIYGAEGLNVPLMFIPTRLIAPTLRRYGANIGERVRFRSPLVIHNSDAKSRDYYLNLSVGNDCYLGRELFLDLQDRIEIEDQVTISHRVMILTHTDAGPSPLKDMAVPTSQAPVIIRRGAYIGANVTILEGVEIGESSVIGAGAVVTQSVPPHAVAVGIPAKPVRSIQAAERKKLYGVK